MSELGMDMSKLFAEFVKLVGNQQADASPIVTEGGKKVLGAKVESVEKGDCSSVASGSKISWADEVADNESSVELKGAPIVSEKVKRLSFAAEDDEAYEQRKGRDAVNGAGGGMSMYVKTTSARMVILLLQSAGVKLPKKAQFDVALVTYSAATMPAFFRDGKARHKSLAVVGDAAFTLVAVSDALANGMHVESTQYFRSTVLSDSNMRLAFVKSQYRHYVSFGTNVDPGTSKSGATAIEAIAGVVFTYCGIDAVRLFAKQVELSVAVSH